MNHLVAFYGNIAPNVDTELSVVPDTILTQPSATRIRIPGELTTIHFAFASSVNLVKAEIVTPSLEVRRVTQRIIPHNRGSLHAYVSNAIIHKPVAETGLVATEDLSVVVRQNGAAAEYVCVLLSLKTPGDLPAIPAGDVRLIRATGSKTLTPGQWTLVTPVFDKALEPGEYAVVGLLAISPSLLACRVSFPGQVYRPGVVGLPGVEEVALVYDGDYLEFIQGYEFGRFTHIATPNLECLASGADTSQVFYFLTVKTA